MPTIGGTDTAVIAGVDAIVLHGESGSFKVAEESSAEMTYLCAYSSAQAMARRLRGVTTYAASAFVITNPLPHPTLIGMYVTEVSVEPFGKPSGMFTWDWAKVKATYAPLPIVDSAPDTNFETESLEFGGQVETRAKETMGFAVTSGVPELIDRDAQKVIPLVSYGIQKDRLPSLPVSAILSACGKLNSGTFRGASTETMLFSGASASRKFNSDGVAEWSVSYKFLYNPNNHNMEWRASTGAYAYCYAITSAGTLTSTKKYGTVDFTTLGISATSPPA